MNRLINEWQPKKPNKSINKTLVDFEIFKRLTSNKITDKKGHSQRGFTDIQAEVKLFYYDIRNKHLAHMLKKRGFEETPPVFPKFNGNISFQKNYKDRNQSLVSRKEMISEASRYVDYVLIIRGEPSKVLSESLKKVRGTGHNRAFLTDWENVTTYNFTDHINHVEDLAAKEIAGDSVQFGIYNQHDPSDILLAKIKLSEQSFETISQRTGVPLTMIYRHTQNKAPIARQHAIQYAKYFGMDPAEILFNDISIPLGGEVSFENNNPGEVVKDFSTYELAKCPRDIYRPDIQCVKVNSPGSIYNNCNLFYYQDFQGEIQNNQLCIFMILGEQGVGINNKIQDGIQEDEPYKVIGRFSKNKAGEVSIKNPDPEIYDRIVRNNLEKMKYPTGGFINDIDLTNFITQMNETHCTLNGKFIESRYFLKLGILAISPIISVINRELTVKDAKRASIIKEEDAWYASRTLAEGKSVRNNLSKMPNNKSNVEDYTISDKGSYEVDLDKLNEKLKIIEKNVKAMGYPHFNLPDPKNLYFGKQLNSKKSEINLENNDLIEKEGLNLPKWLIDPSDDVPVKIGDFIKEDPKKAAEFFQNEDYKKSEESLTKIRTGTSKGEDRAIKAAEVVINKIKKENSDFKKSTEILIVVTGGRNTRLDEVDKIINKLRREMNPDTEVIFGMIVDENMEDDIRVSVMSVAQGKLEDRILINNAVSNYYFYKSIGARKDALKLALGSPALKDNHRDEVLKIISEKTPEVSRYPKAEIYPFRKVS